MQLLSMVQLYEFPGAITSKCPEAMSFVTMVMGLGSGETYEADRGKVFTQNLNPQELCSKGCIIAMARKWEAWQFRNSEVRNLLQFQHLLTISITIYSILCQWGSKSSTTCRQTAASFHSNHPPARIPRHLPQQQASFQHQIAPFLGGFDLQKFDNKWMAGRIHQKQKSSENMNIQGLKKHALVIIQSMSITWQGDSRTHVGRKSPGTKKYRHHKKKLQLVKWYLILVTERVHILWYPLPFSTLGLRRVEVPSHPISDGNISNSDFFFRNPWVSLQVNPGPLASSFRMSCTGKISRSCGSTAVPRSLPRPRPTTRHSLATVDPEQPNQCLVQTLEYILVILCALPFLGCLCLSILSFFPDFLVYTLPCKSKHRFYSSRRWFSNTACAIELMVQWLPLSIPKCVWLKFTPHTQAVKPWHIWFNNNNNNKNKNNQNNSKNKNKPPPAPAPQKCIATGHICCFQGEAM